MFEGRNMLCSEGKTAQLVCTYADCDAYLFVCSKKCQCFLQHNPKCVLKNLKDLSNGLETVLKRNFCKTFKGEGIEVIARVARQTIASPKNYRFCFTQCRADGQKDMQFLIRTLKGCVGVGILHKPTIIRSNFQYLPDQDYINHGGYMILSNGYQYSHSELGQNFTQYEGIRLEEGSKVKLYVRDQKLIFEQAGNKVSLSLPAGLENIYYGVYLYEQGDEVEVLVKK